MKWFFILRHYEDEPGSVIMSEAGSASLLNIPASSIDVDYKKVNKEILRVDHQCCVFQYRFFLFTFVYKCLINLLFI